MIIPTVILYLGLALGAGAYLGYGAGERAVPTASEQLPSYRENGARMLQCRQFCGKSRVKSYEALTGDCTCRGR